MSTAQYILRGRDPIAEPNLIAWAEWMVRERDARRVGETRIGLSCVSTIFLGLDHAFSGPPPILFETMIFGGPEHGVSGSV